MVRSPRSNEATAAAHRSKDAGWMMRLARAALRRALSLSSLQLNVTVSLLRVLLARGSYEETCLRFSFMTRSMIL
eukprot:164819-Hanusia_phi.AAC.2